MKDQTQRPNCPTCDGPLALELGGSTTLMAGGGEFFDDSGTLHHHEPNWTTTLGKCFKGHNWTVKFRSPCPADGCDFESFSVA